MRDFILKAILTFKEKRSNIYSDVIEKTCKINAKSIAGDD